MQTEFQIGDKVQLVRGGPVMTVYELGEKFIRVGWVMSQDMPAKVWINPNVLKLASTLADQCGTDFY